MLNDHVASVVKAYPKRFLGLGSVPLQVSPIHIFKHSAPIIDFISHLTWLCKSSSAASTYGHVYVACHHIDIVAQELGLSGVQIGSHVEKWNLDAPELRPFFKVVCIECSYWHK